ncbi:hypothetical protein L596_009213 [Steinernema carpocapsae]|uniref:C2H2-type domain-containing protein n=1 Tax=Steinernema carpocapsae TaxID=34508 RepID=A0A4U5PEW3_STECR|nr:hypothetical protein L596_009213 [Steinernema carpocapsae]
MEAERSLQPEAVRCQACFFEYDSPRFLLEHLNAVADDDIHKFATIECTHCEEAFPSVHGLLKHVRVVHKSVFVTFPEEPKLLDASESPKRQIRKPRKKALPNKCGECGKIVAKASDFKRHLVSHSKEKAYVCHVCDARFGLETNLNVHLKSHDESAEKPEFLCAVCRKTYLSMSSLKLHLRKHTNESPLKCEFPKCGQSFRTSKMRRDHVSRDHKKLVKKVPKANTEAERRHIVQMMTDLRRSSTPPLKPKVAASSSSAFCSVQQKTSGPPLVDTRNLLVKIQPYFIVQNPGPQMQLLIFVSYQLLENLSREGLNLRVPLNFDMFPTGASLLIDSHSTILQFSCPLNQYSVVAQPIPEGTDAVLSKDCSLLLRVPAHVSIPAQYLVHSSLYEGNTQHAVSFSLVQINFEQPPQQPLPPPPTNNNYWSFTPIDDLMFFPSHAPSPCDDEIASLMNNRSSSIVGHRYGDAYYQVGPMQGSYSNIPGRFTSAN